MTAASGGPGEQPFHEGEQPESRGHEAPPIEDMPAYGEWTPPPPVTGYPAPPGQGYPPPPLGQGYPPPPPGQGYPPPGAAPYGVGYPPPAPGYPPPPEYGAPYPGGYGYPPAAADTTNKLAIFSLVASAVGLLCGVGSIVGIGLGAVALNQIKRSGEKGYGLAVAGIVVGVASLIISLIWLTFATNGTWN